MATPPTFVATYASVWNTTTSPKTASVTVNVGDSLVIGMVTANNATDVDYPTGGGLNYIRYVHQGLANNVTLNIYVADSNSSQTFTMSHTKLSGTDHWGFAALRFSGTLGGGVKNSLVSTGAPSVSLTPDSDNNAIIAFVGDWNAVDGSLRTWATVNGYTPDPLGILNTYEVVYAFDSGAYTVYAAYWPDAGTGGSSVSPGLTAPTGQAYSIGAVALYGDSEPGSIPPVQPAGTRARAAVTNASTW